ncbi:MAG TPA: hypothetical protein VK116_04435, partial [Planctomycetota bacterium]|nr:hypothetical protein [Planctomycetota bacterium]
DPKDESVPAPPEGGLVLRVHARFLARDGEGQGALRRATLDDFPLLPDEPGLRRVWRIFIEPNVECLWLTAAEWQALVPKDPKVGETIAVDRRIAERMARFHLTPQRATTSEGGIVRKDRLKEARIELEVTEVSSERVAMDLRGFVHWGSDYDESKATSPNGPLAQGYETPLHGRLEVDRSTGRFTRFDIVAPGDVWGRWGDANGKSMVVERPGRAPFGFAFELATGDSPTDRIPPGGNGRYVAKETGYFGE